MKKRFLSLILVLCMIFTMMPSMAYFDPPELDLAYSSIIIENGDTTGKVKLTYGEDSWEVFSTNTINITQTDAETTTPSAIVISADVTDGVNIMLNGVNIQPDGKAALEITENAGKVNLILADNSDNKLTGDVDYAGLQKNNTAKGVDGLLTISCESAGTGHTCDGTCGKLTTTGGYYGAGIGGGNLDTGSHISIYGGDITATGGVFGGAGIGGGNGREGSNINIYGGSISATGNGFGAGIGGGYGGAGSNINIYSGSIIASSNGGAGIGGGDEGAGSNIDINGGNINATSNGFGAGIGGGGEGEGSNINIYGGNINATGRTGIGGGSEGTGSYINISGGIVTAVGKFSGAGIGGGYKKDGSNITISGGIVSAVGGNNGGAAIGGGSGYYSSSIGYIAGGKGIDITISGGTVTANSTSFAYGIGGGGDNVKGDSSIIITGGNIHASSIGGTPKNSSGTEVYKATFSIPGDTTGGTTLDAISFNINNTPYSYNMNDTRSILDGDTGKLFVYLPVGTYSTLYTGKTYTAEVDDMGLAEFVDLPPAVLTLSPADNTTDISKDTNLVITFSENVVKGTGNIIIKKTSDNSVIETIDVTGGQVTGGGTATITINPSVTLGNGIEYYVQIDATAFKDASDNSYIGIADTTSWSFTTAEEIYPPDDDSGNTPTPLVITVAEVKSELFSNAGDIKVEADVVSAFGKSVEVKITDDEESQKEIFKLAGADGKVYPFDISLYSKGSNEKVQPKDGYSVKITLPVPEALLADKDKIIVVYGKDGKLETLKSELIEKDGKWYIVFEAFHFSPYALIVSTEPWINPFSDVKEGHWYYSAVQYVSQNGLMLGTGGNTFSPQLTTNRGMIATILYRLSGSDEALESTFKDVNPDAYYAKAVAWAQEKSIIAGYGNGIFGPEDSITREQMAAILWRYAGSPVAADSKGLAGFKDVGEISSYAKNALAWANQMGIINGKGNGILDPKGYATRAEVAQIMYNFEQKTELE